jgi:hypothetical protein
LVQLAKLMPLPWRFGQSSFAESGHPLPFDGLKDVLVAF